MMLNDYPTVYKNIRMLNSLNKLLGYKHAKTKKGYYSLLYYWQELMLVENPWLNLKSVNVDRLFGKETYFHFWSVIFSNFINYCKQIESKLCNLFIKTVTCQYPLLFGWNPTQSNSCLSTRKRNSNYNGQYLVLDIL